VGLNALLLESPHSGTATYTRNLTPLLPEVAPDLAFTAYLRGGDLNVPGVPTIRLRTPIDGVAGVAAARASKLLWEETILPAASASRGDSLLHYLYFAAPVVASARTVVTIHDLIPLVMPGYHRSRQSKMYSRFMAWAVKRSEAVITVSEYSKREIIRVLGLPDRRVHVTHEAAAEACSPRAEPGERERLDARYGLPPRFVLYLGGTERRKNLETLVRAWQPLVGQMKELDISLVVVASFPPADALYPDIPRLVRDLGIDGVRFIPAVEEADKPALFRAATVFVFPSAHEGFGLPPLEAMASGTPVVASDATSIPEVVGDAAVLVPPRDIPAWSAAIGEMVRSDALRSDLRRRGIEQAARFSWRRTAEETAAVYHRVLAA
jgi:glycosyltransferase involved in cell wall biosynthesis